MTCLAHVIDLKSVCGKKLIATDRAVLDRLTLSWFALSPRELRRSSSGAHESLQKGSGIAA
ncbi:hypothetical protein N8463_02995 [Synechococcus sp. AH-601-P06]|nr:hypothetical protein [Synechococcus sp. AH-601-P06]